MSRLAVVLFSLALTGCTDTISQGWSWISSFFDAYVDPLICYLHNFFVGVLQIIIDTLADLVGVLVQVLPSVSMPSFSLSGVDFLNYAAYFLPIQETAYLARALLYFYASYWLLRALLRWLKLVR